MVIGGREAWSCTNRSNFLGGLVMQRVFWLLVLLGALLLSAVAAPADDGFYVIGSGRPTPGTRINSLPYPINASGYYYLPNNLTCPAGQDGIIINVDNVTIDLMGFCLNGPTGSWTNTGISMNGRTNVEIKNGSMTYWGNCIQEANGTGHRVVNVRVQCYDAGVNLGGSGHVIQGCTAYRCIRGLTVGNGIINGCTVVGYAPTSYGISGTGTISGNVVMDCTKTDAAGILAPDSATISYNVVSNCSTGISVGDKSSVIGNHILANTGQTGFVLAAEGNMLDQNAVSGSGTSVGGPGTYVGGVNGLLFP
jgi:hypothetical protein